MAADVTAGVVLRPGVMTARVRLSTGVVVTALNGLHVRVPPGATVLVMQIDREWRIVSRDR